MKKLLFSALLINGTVQADLMITGVVESGQTQQIIMPLVRSFQGKISEMVPEGSFVEQGDFVIRMDGSELDTTIEGKIEALDVFKASSNRDMIQLKIDHNNANLAHEKAIVDQKVAALRAQVPVNFIGELEYKERQLALKQSQKALDEAVKKLQEVAKKTQEKEQEIVLGLKQKEDELSHWQERLASLTIKATQSGYVIYSSHPWTGSKYQTGDQVQTGMEVLKVSQKEDMKVKAWVNAIDVPKIQKGQQVTVHFDALPGVSEQGTISHISSGGHDKKDWGDGLYYEIEVDMDAKVALLPGMSALIQVEGS